MLTLARWLAYTVDGISVATKWSINAVVRAYPAMAGCYTQYFACVAFFFEQMHDAVKLLVNVSEEQIA